MGFAPGQFALGQLLGFYHLLQGPEPPRGAVGLCSPGSGPVPVGGDCIAGSWSRRVNPWAPRRGLQTRVPAGSLAGGGRDQLT